MRPDSPLHSRVTARLARLASDGLLRSLRAPAGIDLSSNDYLGLASHPRVCEAFARGVAELGAGSTGSRLLRGDRDVFRALEDRFARFKGTDRSLLLSSGYLANLAVFTGLPEAGDVIFSDERVHASIIDAVRLSRAHVVVVPHNDAAALRRAMRDTECAGVRFVAIESLYSMDGDFAPLADYEAVCHDSDAVLVVDEAHAVGIYGARGTGMLEDTAIDANGCFSINTGGKALGVGGALIAGPSWGIEYLLQRARPFVFSTAPPPAMAAALDASLDVVEQEPDRRARLLALSMELRNRLRRAGVDVPAGSSQIIPVLLGDNERAMHVADRLQADGFDVRAIRPPSVPAGTARLRVSVNVNLPAEDMARFVSLLVGTLACSTVSS